jgi:hypothetical protein
VVRGEKMKTETNEEEYKDYLVVEEGEFYIESFCNDEKYDDIHLRSSRKFLTTMLYPNNNPLNERFLLRSFTQSEREEINRTPTYMFPGEKVSHPPLRHFLNRWLNTTLVLGAEEFNRISMSKPITKPIVVIQR